MGCLTFSLTGASAVAKFRRCRAPKGCGSSPWQSTTAFLQMKTSRNTTWLELVGTQGWVALLKDAEIRRRPPRSELSSSIRSGPFASPVETCERTRWRLDMCERSQP
jgi:hypothetical protein